MVQVANISDDSADKNFWFFRTCRNKSHKNQSETSNKHFECFNHQHNVSLWKGVKTNDETQTHKHTRKATNIERNASERKRIQENLVSLIKIASIQLSIIFNCSWHAETPPRCFSTNHERRRLQRWKSKTFWISCKLLLSILIAWLIKVCNFV